VINEWLKGDYGQPPPSPGRMEGRNAEWGHLFNRDVMSMPDKWEYPWVSYLYVFNLIGVATLREIHIE
jgi:hypothetical protein